MSMELSVIKQQMPIIEINFDEIKAGLTEKMKEYKGLVVTEQTLKDCVATQKDIASLRIKIDNYRKEVKKETEKPIKAFEAQCKELIAVIEDVEKPIKEGIAAFEDLRKEEKRNEILEIIKGAVADYKLSDEFASMLTIDDKYLNNTQKESDTIEDIARRAQWIKEQQDNKEKLGTAIVSQIETMNSVFNLGTPLKESDFRFNSGDDISAIMKMIAEEAKKRSDVEFLSKQKAEEQMRLAKERTELALQAEREKQIQQAPVEQKVVEVPVIEPQATVLHEPVREIAGDADPILTFRLELTGPKSKLTALKQFIESNGITYTKI